MGYNISKIKEFYLKDETLKIPQIPKDYNLAKNVIFRGNFQNKDIKNNYIDEFITKLNKKLPIVSYMETKTNSDILYSHPEFLDLQFDNFANIKDYKSIPTDTINKWYDTFEFHNFEYLNFIFSMFFSDIKDKINVEEKIKNIKVKFEEFHENLQKNEKIKEKYLNIKIFLSMLQSLKRENIKDIEEWSNLIVQDIGPIINSNYEVLMFVRNDLINIINKVKSMFTDSLKPEEKQSLLKILFNISESFKFFHGFLSLIELMEEKNLNFFSSINKSILYNHSFSLKSIEFNEKCKLMPNTSFTKEQNLLLKFSSPSFTTDKEFFYCYDENFGLAKFFYNVKLNQNKFNLVRINENAKQPGIGQIIHLRGLLFLVLENRFLEKMENKTFLDVFHVFNTDDLIEVKDIKFEMDVNSQLFFNNLEKTSSFQNFKYKEMEYTEGSERPRNNVLITTDSDYIYIFSRFTKIKENDPYKLMYLSENFIYCVDIFRINHTYSLRHIRTIHLKDVRNLKKEENRLLDEVFDNKMISIHCGNLIGYTSSMNAVVYDLISNEFVGKFNLDKKTTTPLAIFNDLSNKMYIISDSSFKSSTNLIDLNCVSLECFTWKKQQQYTKDLKGPENNLLDDLSLIYSLQDQSEKSDTSIKSEEKNIFNNIFNINFDNDQIVNNENIEDTSAREIAFDLYLLSNFSLSASFKLFKECEDNVESSEILSFLKVPYVLNLEYPTFKLMTKLFINSWNKYLSLKESNKEDVRLKNTLLKTLYLLRLVEYHLDQIRFLKCDLKVVFRNEKEIEELVENIVKIITFNMKQESEINKIVGNSLFIHCNNILFNIFQVSNISNENMSTQLMSILEENFVGLLKLKDLNQMILKRLFDLLKDNVPFVFNKVFEDKFLSFVSTFCENESMEIIEIFIESKKSNIITNLGIAEKSTNYLRGSLLGLLSNILIFIQSNLTTNPSNDLLESYFNFYNNLSKKVLSLSKVLLQQVLDKSNSQNEISVVNLFERVCSNSMIMNLNLLLISYSNIDALPSFIIKNWSLVGDNLLLLSKLKEKSLNLSLISKKVDIIIENLQFEDKENTNRSATINLSQSFKQETSVNLFVDFKVLCSLTDQEYKLINIDYSGSGTEKSVEISINEKLFKTSNGENFSYQQIQGVDTKVPIRIILQNLIGKTKDTEPKVIFKLRISNYQFYQEVIDCFLNPTINLFNKIVRYTLFYENDNYKNSVSQELLVLYTTRIFSGGIYPSQEDESNKINSDYNSFLYELQSLNKPKYEKITENFIKEMYVKPDYQIEFEDILELKGEMMQGFDKVIKILDKTVKLISKEFMFTGDIPDKLLRCTFFIIVHHENLLTDFNEMVSLLHSNCSEIIEKDDWNEDDIEIVTTFELFNFFLILWKVSSQMRKWYKAQKDEIMRKNNENPDEIVVNYFTEVYRKLGFLYYLRKSDYPGKSYLENFKSCENTRKMNEQSIKIVTCTKKNTILRKFNKIEEYSHFLIQKTNEHVHNIVYICKNEAFTINLIRDGFQYMNVKAKFREIGLNILLDIINTLSDQEVKINILSNFYQNFSQVNNIPSIFERLHISSPILSENILIAFHRFLDTILHEIKSVESPFILSVLLNCLIWNIKARDFQFFNDSKLFNVLFSEPPTEILVKANNLLYIIPEVVGKRAMNEKFSIFSEIRPIDIPHVSKVLTDIFNIYSNLIFQRIVRETIKNSSKAKREDTFLVRANSVLSDNYMDLVNVVYDVIDSHLQKITNIFLENQETDIVQSVNNFPIDDKTILRYNLQLNQKKLYNILSNFYKLILVKDEKLKTPLKNVNLTVKLLILMLFSGHKTLRLLSHIIKIVLVNYDHSDNEYLVKKFIENYEKYFKFTSFLKYEDHFYFIIEYLFSLAHKKEKIPDFFKIDDTNPHMSNEIICDILRFIYKVELWKEKINSYIIKSLENNNNIHNTLSILGIKVGYFSYGRSVVTNSKLKLANKRLDNKFDQNDLNCLVKNGYYIDFIEAANFVKKKKNKEVKNENESESESVNIKLNQDEEEIVPSDKYVILMKNSANRDTIKHNNPDYIYSEYNDLIESNELGENTIQSIEILNILLNFVEKIIVENEVSPYHLLISNAILRYFNNLMCVKESSNYFEVSNFRVELMNFAEKNKEFINKIAHIHNETKNRFSLISLENLERWLSSVILNNSVIDIHEKRKFNMEVCEENKLNKLVSENKSKKIYAKANLETCTIYMFPENFTGLRLIVPYLDILLFFKNNDEFEEDIFFENFLNKLLDIVIYHDKLPESNGTKKKDTLIYLTDNFFLKNPHYLEPKINTKADNNDVSDDEDQDEEEEVDEEKEEEEEEETAKRRPVKISGKGGRKRGGNKRRKPMKKQIKVKKQEVQKISKEEKEKLLNDFKEHLKNNYDLDNCIVFVSSKIFKLFPKVLITIAYDTNVFDFTCPDDLQGSLVYEELYEYIKKKLDVEVTESNKKYSEIKNIVANIKKTQKKGEKVDKKEIKEGDNIVEKIDFFDSLKKQFDLKDILPQENVEDEKDKKMDEKIKGEIVKFKDRKFKNPKLFKDLYQSFPIPGQFKDFKKEIFEVGALVFKQNLRYFLLLVKNNNEDSLIKSPETLKSEINMIKTLYYQKLYLSKYFNLQKDICNVKEFISKHILSDPLLREYPDILRENLFNQKLFDYNDNPLLEKFIVENLQDELMLNCIKNLFEKSNAKEHIGFIKKVMEEILNSLSHLMKSDKFEKIQKLIEMLKIILTEICKIESDNSELLNEILQNLNSSVFFNSVMKFLISSNQKKSDLNISFLELMIFVLDLLTTKKVSTLKNSIFNTDYLNLFYSNFEIIKNKFSSERVREFVIEESENVVNLRKFSMKIPDLNDYFLMVLNSKLSSSINVEINNNSSERNNLLALGSIREEKMGASDVINRGQIKRITLDSNKFYYANDKESNLVTKLYGNLNSKKVNELKLDYSIKFVADTSNFLIALTHDNKLLVNGYFGNQFYKGFKEDEDLKRIQENEKVLQITFSSILTDKFLYLLQSRSYLSITMERINISITRIVIPQGVRFVGASLSDESLIMWTENGLLWGYGSNRCKELSSDSMDEINVITPLVIPEGMNVKCIKVKSSNESFLFLMKETNNKTYLYASGKNKYGHCSFPVECSDEYLKKITALESTEIIDFDCEQSLCCAVSSDFKLYYWGQVKAFTNQNDYDSEDDEDSNEGNIYQPKLSEYFSNKKLNVTFVRVNSKSIFVKCVDTLDHNKIRYFGIGNLKCLGITNTYSFDEPKELKIFTEAGIENDEGKIEESKGNGNEEININEACIGKNKSFFVATSYKHKIPSLESVNQSKAISERLLCFMRRNESNIFSETIQEVLIYQVTIKELSDFYVVNCVLSNSEDIKRHHLYDNNLALEHNFKYELETGVNSKSYDFSKEKSQIFEKILSIFQHSLPVLESLILEKSILHSEINTKKIEEVNFLEVNVLRKFNDLGKEFYLDQYISCRQLVTDALKQIDELYIEEFIKIKKSFANSPQASSKSLEEFIIEKYSKYDLYIHLSNPLHIRIIRNVVELLANSVSYLLNNISLDYETYIIDNVISNICYLDSSLREEQFKARTSKLARKNHNPDEILIDRAKTMNLKNKNKVDRTGEYTIFSQLYKNLKSRKGTYFRVGLNQKLFEVNLLNEGAIDAGGPFREVFTQVYEDLQSKYMELLIPTPNNKSKTGQYMEKWTINPSAKNELYLDMFKFLGKLFGFSILSCFYVPISLPSFIWKQILNLKLTPIDIELIDVQAYKSIIRILQFKEKYKTEFENLCELIDYTCVLSNGDTVELVPGGQNLKLTQDNDKEFLQLFLNARYNECKPQIKAIQEGLWEVIDKNSLKFLTWEDLEEKVCGVVNFDLELFKRNTKYDGYTENDNVIQFFWRFIEECTLEEKYEYLKFVWGRSRLPKEDKEFKNKHTITKYYGDANGMPIAHTCFFSIDLPNYSSYEILKEKLSYSMKNSYLISDRGGDIFFNIEN